VSLPHLMQIALRGDLHLSSPGGRGGAETRSTPPVACYFFFAGFAGFAGFFGFSLAFFAAGFFTGAAAFFRPSSAQF